MNISYEEAPHQTPPPKFPCLARCYGVVWLALDNTTGILVSAQHGREVGEINRHLRVENMDIVHGSVTFNL